MGTSSTQPSGWTGTQVGTSTSNDYTAIGVAPVTGTITTTTTTTPGGYHLGPALFPRKAIIQVMENGEFEVLGKDPMGVIMEYLSANPEIWLRLMAIKAEQDNDETAT